MKNNLYRKIFYLLMASFLTIVISACQGGGQGNNTPGNSASTNKLQTSATTLPFKIVNNSPAYLNSQTTGCPTLAPGQTENVGTADNPIYWCGYVACSSKDYDSVQGCMEVASSQNPTTLVQGGYLGYFSLSLGSNLCTVGGAATTSGLNPYQCNYDNVTGNFTWQYQSLTQYYTAGANVGHIVTVLSPRIYASLPLRGVNISGMEYDGTYGDAMYQLPDLPDAQYFIQEGMNTVRLPIRAEFWFADNNGNESNMADSHLSSTGALPPYPNTIYRAAVVDIVGKYLANGVNVILDLHNYMRFCATGLNEGQGNEPTDPVINNCSVMTKTQFSQVWTAIANESGIKNLANAYPTKLLIGLQNEPFSESSQLVTTQSVFNNEVAAIKAIRAAGITNNLIVMSGNYWDPLHGWPDFVPTDGSAAPGDVANGQMFTKANLAAKGISDPYLAIEMHQYFDYDYSGRNESCNQYSSYADFESKLDITGIPQWMKTNQMRVILSEFGSSNESACQTDMNYMLNFVESNTYVSGSGGFIGWTAWRANRHAPQPSDKLAFSPFNYLNQANYNVYAGTGVKPYEPNGTGINQGQGNGVMQSVFINYNHITPVQ